ncbi:MAG: HD domain-containing protein [Balneolaceae bacterium]|nr:MAG: HD domain-containing protein [Balneolaceae bacterium]
MKLTALETICRNFLRDTLQTDSAHDLAHTERVVANAKLLLQTEKADKKVVLAAAWLHDCVLLPKNHPDRKQASARAADEAAKFLENNQFPETKIHQVRHAIHAHSFSAGITPRTIEAKIVQDADRLDALGAIGIARCFLTGGELKRTFSHPDDPFCENREPDDSRWTIDHFYAKLLKLPETMNTNSAKKEAQKRAAFMQTYLDHLREEMGSF